jgi:hypothetical protein
MIKEFMHFWDDQPRIWDIKKGQLVFNEFDNHLFTLNGENEIVKVLLGMNIVRVGLNNDTWAETNGYGFEVDNKYIIIKSPGWYQISLKSNANLSIQKNDVNIGLPGENAFYAGEFSMADKISVLGSADAYLVVTRI